MRVNIYKYTIQCGNCVNARLLKTLDIKSFPNNQVEFARQHGGDFIEIEEHDDDILYWAGSHEAYRQGHFRELLKAGVDE